MPVFPLRRPLVGIFSRSKSTSRSWIGELMLKGPPASSKIAASVTARVARYSVESFAKASASTRTPRRSMAANTARSGISTSWKSSRPPCSASARWSTGRSAIAVRAVQAGRIGASSAGAVVPRKCRASSSTP